MDGTDLRRSDVTEDTAAATAARGPEALGQHEMADFVQVRMPAEGAYLSVLRTAAAGLAARLDFTLDEACAVLLEQAIPGTDLECVFELGNDQVTITVSVTAAQPRMPARNSWAWTVLSELAGTVDSRLGPGDRVSIVLAKRRGVSGSG
jgi:serine/threonine-protein kinase RsbW